MKLSAFHKNKNDSIKLYRGYFVPLDVFNKNPDKAYISSIFTWNRDKALELYKELNGLGISTEIGGSGIELTKKLPSYIEHIMPDYKLYNLNYSIGFSSRGCIRKCPWCIVPKKEGMIYEHAPITEFLHPFHSKIILLDNNFLASPLWKEKLQFLIDKKLKVSFNQGLDIRLINHENATMLNEAKVMAYKFNRKCLYFSFDLMEIEKEVIRGINILTDIGFNPSNMMFYILCGFDTSEEEDLYRVNLIIKKGCVPFVMKYNNKQTPFLNRLARWCNRMYYKVCSFEEYNPSKYKKYDNSSYTLNL